MVEFKFDNEIEYTTFDGVLVKYDGNKAVIGTKITPL